MGTRQVIQSVFTVRDFPNDPERCGTLSLGAPAAGLAVVFLALATALESAWMGCDDPYVTSTRGKPDRGLCWQPTGLFQL